MTTASRTSCQCDGIRAGEARGYRRRVAAIDLTQVVRRRRWLSRFEFARAGFGPRKLPNVVACAVSSFELRDKLQGTLRDKLQGTLRKKQPDELQESFHLTRRIAARVRFDPVKYGPSRNPPLLGEPRASNSEGST